MSELEFSKDLQVEETDIPGLLLFDLPVHGDPRGWFKENWQREKMTKLGLPELGPVQNNVSFNAQRGVTRGIHAEPWDKYISIGSGRIFGAWVDLREGESFGKVFTAELDPSKAIFVPRGVGNAFQALEDNTVYMYLVNDHWSAASQSLYTFLNLADETANIAWPIPLSECELSDKDKAHPRLTDVQPMKPRNVLIVGADTAIGCALLDALPSADYINSEELGTTGTIHSLRSWRQYDTIINATAYMKVDNAETKHGREEAWQENVQVVTELARISAEYLITLIHFSSDYVFDGVQSSYDESAPLSPINVFGQTKAAADAVVATAPRHYIVRTGWLIGKGKSFVDTMLRYINDDVSPRVVNDQVGRPTFARDVAAFTAFLVHGVQSGTPVEYGVYNYTSDGTPTTWAELATTIFAHYTTSASVQPISTAEYQDENPAAAKRPLQNILQLDKVKLLGITPPDWKDRLNEYLKGEDND